MATAAEILARYDADPVPESGMVNVITPEGSTVSIPSDSVSYAIDRGFRLEDSAMEAERITREQRAERYGGVANSIRAGLAGAARGLTFGASDVVARAFGGKELAEDLAGWKEANPGISTATEIVGAVAPALVSGGATAAARGGVAAAEGGTAAAILRMTPAGLASRAERALTAGGAGSGIVGRAAYAGAGGAVEGALASTGAYLSDVALDRKELSSEAFLGAMGNGLLWGGGIGAGAAMAERGFVAARKLFPSGEVTKESVALAEGTFARAADESLTSGDDLVRASRERLDVIRAEAVASDPVAKAGIERAAAKDYQAALRIKSAELGIEAKQFRLEQARAKAAGRVVPAGEVPAAGAVTETPIVPASTAGAAEDIAASARPAAAPATVSAGAAEDIAASIRPAESAANATTWKQFVKEGMGPAMKEAGSHGGAMKLLGDRWKALKEAAKAGPEGNIGASLGARSADDAIDDVVSGVSEEADKLVAATRNLQEADGQVRAWAAKDQQLAWINKYKRQDGTTTAYEFGGFPGKRLQAGEAHPSNVYARKVGYEPMPKGWEPPAEEGAGVVREQVGDKLISRDQVTGEVYKIRTLIPRTEADIAAGEIRYAELAEDRASRLAAAAEKRKAAAEARGEVYVEKVKKVRKENPDAPEKDVAVVFTPERQAAIDASRDALVAKIEAASAARTTGAQAIRFPGASRSVADDILKSAAAPVSRDIPGRLVDDVQEAVQVLGNYDRATSDLVEALGPAAPPAAQRAAADYAASVERSTAGAAEHTARMLDDAHAAQQAAEHAPGARAATAPAASPAAPRAGLASRIGAAVGAPGKGGIAGKAADVGAALEVLQSVGIQGIPDADKIPVVGPLLGWYLKARAARAVWSRLGGKVPASAEARVASKAASMRDRATHAIDAALGLGAKAAGRAAPVAIPATMAVLARPLFHDEPRKPAPATKSPPTVRELVAQRTDELVRAVTNPEAVRAALRRQVPVANPEMAKAIGDAVERKLAFLAAKVPKDPRAPNPFRKANDWTPDPVEVDRFARYVRAADDPGSVLEHLAHGQVTAEEAEALRSVYPEMFAAVQQHLVLRAADLGGQLPFARRVALSQLFDVQIDDSMEPGYVAYLQSSFKAPEPAGAPAGAAAGGTPPAPSIASNVDISASVMTALDRRAAR